MAETRATSVRTKGGSTMQDGGQLRVERAEIVIDDSGRVLRARAEGRAGRLIEDVEPGAQLFDRLHPDDKDVAVLLIARVTSAALDAAAELRWRRSNGRWHSLLTRFEPQGDGSVRIWLRYDDIAQLRRAEEQMRRVVEGSAQGIVVR